LESKVKNFVDISNHIWTLNLWQLKVPLYLSVVAGRKCWSKSDRPAYQAIIEFLYRSFFKRFAYNDWFGFILVFAQVHQILSLLIEQCLVISFSVMLAWEVDVVNQSLKEKKLVSRDMLTKYRKLSELMNEINKFWRSQLVLIFIASSYFYCVRFTNYLR